MLYATGPDGQKFANGPSEWLTGIPTITNADTLGIRPDLTGRPSPAGPICSARNSRARPRCRTIRPIGIIDVAMALEARGDIKYGNKGNMTRDEIDKTINTDDGDQEEPASSARSGRASTSR